MPTAQRRLRRASRSIPRKGFWKCFGCNTGGSVIDLHAKLRGISIGDAMRDLTPGGSGNGSHEFRPTPAPPRKKGASTPKPSLEGTQPEKEREVCAYDYQDPTGKVVFQVVRYEPKDFKQCRIVDCKRVWNMEGVERFPYRLPDLLVNPASVWMSRGNGMSRPCAPSVKPPPATPAGQANGSRQSRSICAVSTFTLSPTTTSLEGNTRARFSSRSRASWNRSARSNFPVNSTASSLKTLPICAKRAGRMTRSASNSRSYNERLG